MLWLLRVCFILEIHVDMKYKREFFSMRVKLGKLCSKTLQLLKEYAKLADVKYQLGVTFPELKQELVSCETLEAIMEDVIRPRLSLIQLDYLCGLHEILDLPCKPIEEYEEAVRKFCSTMTLQHSYGQILMDELKSHVSKFESITFVLDWKGEKENLNDLKDLFENVVREQRKNITVLVIYEGNSIVIECYVHSSKLPVVIQAIKRNKELLPSVVMRIIAGGEVIFTKSSAEVS